MIALDTNALVRLLVEDDERQAGIVQKAVELAEKNSFDIMILSEVLIETVWVLESVYGCTREEVIHFLEMLISSTPFTLTDSLLIRKAVQEYKKGGDFADLVIVGQARKNQARYLLTFDKRLQKRFPGYVVDRLEPGMMS